MIKRLLIASALFLQAGGQPVNIPISASAWQFGVGATPHGTNGCYVGPGSYCIQTLSKSPADIQEYKPGYTIEGFYTVTFYGVNYFHNYPGYFTAEIHFGIQGFCDHSAWDIGTSTQISFICPSPRYLIVDQTLPEAGGAATGPAQGKQPFVISLSTHGGWQIYFDKVSVTFVQVN